MAAQATKAREPGFDGEPPVMGEPRDLEGEGKRTVEGTVNKNCDRIDWLWNKKDITDRQHDAALRLQADWQVMSLSAYTTASQIGGVSAAKLSMADAKLMAMQRHGQVLEPLYGTRARIIIDHVVHMNHSLGKAAVAAGVNERAALPLLKDGLDIVAKGYGL